MRAALAIAAALVAAGCAGELEDPERFADCAPGYVEQLFQTACGGACHAGDEPAAGLDLVSPGVEDRLIDVVSTTETCGGRPLVASDGMAPEDHLLLDKLAETPSCGGRMPFGGELLPSRDVECVRRWVDETLGVAP